MRPMLLLAKRKYLLDRAHAHFIITAQSRPSFSNHTADLIRFTKTTRPLFHSSNFLPSYEFKSTATFCTRAMTFSSTLPKQ